MKRMLMATAVVAALLSVMQCSNSSSAPTPALPIVTNVGLSATSVTVGTTVQGTVTISASAPSSGVTISLSSSTTAVATVPSNVTVAAGSTSATFSITTVSAGVSTIAASYNNGSQSASLTVTGVPTPAALSGISLNSSTINGGASVDGLVTLTAAAPAGGAVVSLQSSDAGVAQIASSVTVPAGATSASFTVTTRETGGAFTITLTASYSGATRTVILIVAATPPPLALSSITLSAATVIGGGSVQGTATLNQPAPTGGTVVTLSSSVTSVATVPASVTIPAGASTGTFTISITTTTTTQTVTISGAYNNVLQTATLVVTPPLVASFTVTGPSGNDTCTLGTGGTSSDCTFDGRLSTGVIVAWDFTYLIGTQSVSLTSTTGQLSPTFPGCGFFPAPSSVAAGSTSVQMEVRLKVRDAAGNASAVISDPNVKVLPNQQCGFSF